MTDYHLQSLNYYFSNKSLPKYFYPMIDKTRLVKERDRLMVREYEPKQTTKVVSQHRNN